MTGWQVKRAGQGRAGVQWERDRKVVYSTERKGVMAYKAKNELEKQKRRSWANKISILGPLICISRAAAMMHGDDATIRLFCGRSHNHLESCRISSVLVALNLQF